MYAIINPGSIDGSIKVPASKSMMQRACAAALLHKGKTVIYNPGKSEDDKAALRIIEQLGATISFKDDAIEIVSAGINPANEINCGESGLSARLFTPIAAFCNTPTTINGSGSLIKRPMDTIFELLPQLGVSVSTEGNRLPATLQGPLRVQDISIDGSVSSQFLSGLLFAYSYGATSPVTINVSNLKSKPYIDLTLDVLKQFGKIIRHDNYQSFYIDPANFTSQDEVHITIEGDWSSAAPLMAAAALAGKLKLYGLNPESSQADKAVLEVLQKAYANVIVTEEYIEVKKATPLYPFEFDATHCPDLFPVVAILAACCHGESHIKGVHRLFYKESNRIVSIGDMLQALGAFFSIENDDLVIEGQQRLDYATIDSYRDHRIVMAATAGALRAKGYVVITEAEAVSKSYPDFFADLQSVGADILLKDDN